MTFQAQFLRGERARDKIGALHGAYQEVGSTDFIESGLSQKDVQCG